MTILLMTLFENHINPIVRYLLDFLRHLLLHNIQSDFLAGQCCLQGDPLFNVDVFSAHRFRAQGSVFVNSRKADQERWYTPLLQ